MQRASSINAIVIGALLLFLMPLPVLAATWDDGAAKATTDNVTFASNSDAIYWDAPTTFNAFDLNTSFDGSTSALADTNMAVTTNLTVSLSHRDTIFEVIF